MTQEAELGLRDRLAQLSGVKLLRGTRLSAEVERLQRQLERLREDTSDEEIWKRVELARHEKRPYTLDYVERILDDWFELHGDRGRIDDTAMVAGIGRLNGRTIALVGNQKGRDLKTRVYRNYGMAYPEGYRKAMRTMALAERHGFPLVTLIDTPGAYPGVAAEQHGQGGAIARAQAVMLRLGVPSVAVVIGEGGSGGAIAIAVADRVLMQENAMYSVISPEGCAAILWRDASQAKKAASAFKPDAAHCLELGVIDGIVPSRRAARRGPRRRRRAAARRGHRAPGRPRGHLGRRAPPYAAREVPLARRARTRLTLSPHFPQAYPRTEVRDLLRFCRGCDESVKTRSSGPPLALVPPEQLAAEARAGRHLPRSTTSHVRSAHGGARRLPAQAGREPHARAVRGDAHGRTCPLRDPATRRQAAPLRPATRAERSARELGRPQGPPVRAGRAASRGPRRGPPAGLRDVRGSDSGGPVRGGHGRDLGHRHLRAPRGEA